MHFILGIETLSRIWYEKDNFSPLNPPSNYASMCHVMGTVRKNVKTPLKALNEEVLVTTFALLRTVPVPAARMTPYFPLISP